MVNRAGQLLQYARANPLLFISLLSLLIAFGSYINSCNAQHYIENLDKERTRTNFTALCQVVRDGRVIVTVTDRPEVYATKVSSETSCAVRNVGHRPADIVDIRSATVLNGELVTLPGRERAEWEGVGEPVINGKSFTLTVPVNVPPGSQASVVLLLEAPVWDEMLPTVIKKCNPPTIKSWNGLEKCLETYGVSWTDYLQSRPYIPVEPGPVFNGIAALFMLSDGTHVHGEAQFRAGWWWKCGTNQGRDWPTYMRSNRQDACAKKTSG